MNDEIKLILTKLKIVSQTEESGAYICDRGHSKLLLDYITNLHQSNERAFELLQQLHYLFSDNDSIHERIEDIQKVLKGNDDK